MLIFVARYTFLFWLFIGGNSAEKHLLRQIGAADEKIFRLSACTARCLSALHYFHQLNQENGTEDRSFFNGTLGGEHNNQNHQQHRSNLQRCFDECHSTRSGIASVDEKLRKISENFHCQLVCRDDRSLSFRIDLENAEVLPSTPPGMLVSAAGIARDDDQATISSINATHYASKQHHQQEGKANSQNNQNQKQTEAHKVLFFIRLNNATDAENYMTYLSDESFFTIENLKPKSLYNLTVVAVHANNEFSVITKMEQFRTLRSGYTPGMVTHVQVLNFSAINYDQQQNGLLTAKIIWKPSNDMTCHYSIICYSTESGDYDMTPFEIRNPRQLYSYDIENLSFSKEYKVGIRAQNTKVSKESEFYWVTFRAPACVEYYNYNYNICAPVEPRDLHVEKNYLGDNEFSLNITWQMPDHLPDYYTLKILDLADNADSYSMNVSKDQNNVYIENITLRGIMYEVHLVAYTPGGKSAAQVGDVTQFLVTVPDKNHKVKLISAIFAPIFCIVIVSLMIFIICHRRAKLKRYQERCKYFEELEKKAPIDPKATFDFPTKALPLLADDLKQFQLDLEEKIFFSDDAMEIERNDVTLYELLGEGAFGLVRRGVYHNKKSDELHEVAVKMLKEQPSIDDVRAFRREIEVMKSVEKHPNIIGIVGHCTKRCNEMLLLTEYCSLGNLLDFLRNEWKYLHELQLKRIISQSGGKSIRSGSKQVDFSSSTALRLAAINKSYGYDEICTNSCKCQVDIIIRGNQSHHNLSSKQKCDKFYRYTSSSAPIQSNNLDSQGLTKVIAIKDCECQQRQRRLIRNNQRNTLKAKVLAPTTQPPLSVENKAYFKDLINEKSQEKAEQQLQNSGTPIDITIQREPLSASDLLDIAKQVATGMEYLAKNKVVHRDLAARNVLVATDRTVKIADFGLSRDIYQENIYKKSGNGKLPIKWLALESMTHQVYTTQSDVWSYGILLYEIATLGGTPYPAIPTNRLLHLLKSGYRMEKPKNCGQEFYNLMASCWNSNPGERPTFSEIIKTIDQFIGSELAEQQIETAITTIATARKEDTKPTHSLTDDAYLKPL